MIFLLGRIIVVTKSFEELQARIPAEMEKALKTSNDIVGALQALKDEQVPWFI